MLQESPVIPHNLAQVLWLALASILGWTGAEVRSWLARRRREPVELARISAETRQIHVTTDNSQASIGLETLREIQAVIEKAEARREEWLTKEEQLRGQIFHWKCKAEDLDGELQDSRDANAQYEIRARLHEHQIKKLKALLNYHNISYAELDKPKE